MEINRELEENLCCFNLCRKKKSVNDSGENIHVLILTFYWSSSTLECRTHLGNSLKCFHWHYYFSIRLERSNAWIHCCVRLNSVSLRVNNCARFGNLSGWLSEHSHKIAVMRCGLHASNSKMHFVVDQMHTECVCVYFKCKHSARYGDWLVMQHLCPTLFRPKINKQSINYPHSQTNHALSPSICSPSIK